MPQQAETPGNGRCCRLGIAWLALSRYSAYLDPESSVVPCADALSAWSMLDGRYSAEPHLCCQRMRYASKNADAAGAMPHGRQHAAWSRRAEPCGLEYPYPLHIAPSDTCAGVWNRERKEREPQTWPVPRQHAPYSLTSHRSDSKRNAPEVPRGIGGGKLAEGGATCDRCDYIDRLLCFRNRLWCRSLVLGHALLDK